MRCIIASLGDQDSDDGPEFTRGERQVVQRFINELPKPERDVVIARQAGRTPREISSDLGVEFTSVCRTLARVYAALRVKLAQ